MKTKNKTWKKEGMCRCATVTILKHELSASTYPQACFLSLSLFFTFPFLSQPVWNKNVTLKYPRLSGFCFCCRLTCQTHVVLQPHITPPPTPFFCIKKHTIFSPLVHYFASICNLVYNQSCKDCSFLFALFISSLAFFCVFKHFSLALIYLNVFLLTFLVINNW